MYPTEPFKDGIAFIEYVVLNKALGDLDIERCSPFGTLKSRMAVAEGEWLPPKAYAPIPSDERVKLVNRLSSFHPVAL